MQKVGMTRPSNPGTHDLHGSDAELAELYRLEKHERPRSIRAFRQKVSYERDTKIINAASFTIEREENTVGNILRMQLHRDPNVLFAGYKLPHPLQYKILVWVHTTSQLSPMQAYNQAMVVLQVHKTTQSSPMQVYNQAINDLDKELNHLMSVFEVFCLEHRSYFKHHCPKAKRQDVTVAICPLCSKGVHLIPDEDPNITWESHVNTECDPSDYERATKKKRCPVSGCRETLTFSNTIRCGGCTVDHCLKHRFGPDHKCPGPKKPDSGFPFIGLLKRSQSIPNNILSASSPKWATSFRNAASSVKASASAGMAKLSIGTSQALHMARDVQGQSSSGIGHVEECPQCQAKFTSVTSLIEHVERVHESGSYQVTIDVCPRCSKGFRDPVSLVEHVESEHGATSKA
ncbi:hypothetical protein NE237_008756 [Protea cynaroides]|uniref:Uncharacterized protein n=1 Tax=Protea cynaroides TaxID=273540 RepID=A0A9Q0KXB5_9MAGN|nr:hypothetical protein NE237_008756 [Protea cynaroides]